MGYCKSVGPVCMKWAWLKEVVTEHEFVQRGATLEVTLCVSYKRRDHCYFLSASAMHNAICLYFWLSHALTHDLNPYACDIYVFMKFK